MSRGPGRVYRAVRSAFEARPDHVFSTHDVLSAAYPGVTTFEHKHVVDGLRAANRVAADIGWKRERGKHVRYLGPESVARRAWRQEVLAATRKELAAR